MMSAPWTIEHDDTRFELSVVDGLLAWRVQGRRVTLRHVVGEVESYEPAVSMTRIAREEYRNQKKGQKGVRAGGLAKELRQLLESDVVLSRGLREGALESRFELSEIAVRCGKSTRKSHGRKPSGDTTWLSRRLGLRPETGKRTPTPWVHTDVLALIAREGLGVAPMDVELGWNVDEPVG